MKYLGVDLGGMRIGLAISDQNGIIARPAGIVSRTSDEEALSEIASMCSSKGVHQIVLGVPLSARQSVQESFRSFGRALAVATGLPVREWDETFSTKQAQNMVAFSDSRQEKKKTRTHRDDVAAAVILQEFLDYETTH